MSYIQFARELKDLGDPPADEVVRELLDEGRVNSVNQLFRQISSANSDIPSQTPARLRDFLESTRAFPDWMEEARLRDTTAFFDRHRAAASALQGTVGLVGTYLSPVSAYTLHATHQLSHQPHRRLSQSTRLFTGMSRADAFSPRSPLVPICQKVRLVHAAIRELHRRSGRWDYERMGAPVSQLDTAGAALALSVGVLDGMRNLGLRVGGNEADGFVYAWAVLAHFLGVPDKYIAEMGTRREATELWMEAREYEWRRSDEGVLLTRECVALYESYMPPELKGAVSAFLRKAMRDEYADMVRVPQSAYDLGASVASLGVSAVLGTPAGGNAIVDAVLKVLGDAVEDVARKAAAHGEETEPRMSDRIG
ncbi:oxygenase MpaB family protein [Allonocardiopsis opalescens]|nr:oxygenase MpaB family protein [Allonocardiopsis opalescens]